MKTHPSLPAAIFALAFVPTASLPAAVISSLWSGAVSRSWTDKDNWTPDTVPDNSGADTFAVTLPASEPSPVQLNATLDIDSLEIGTDTTLALANARTLTIHKSLTNNGIVDLKSTGSNTHLYVSDTADHSTTIGGTGRIVMDDSSEWI